MAAESKKRKEVEEEADALQELFDELARRRKAIRMTAREESANIRNMLKSFLHDEWKGLKIEGNAISSEGDLCICLPDDHYVHVSYNDHTRDVDVELEQGDNRVPARQKKLCKELEARLNKPDHDALVLKDALRWFDSMCHNDMVQNQGCRNNDDHVPEDYE